jgi:dipeptidyl aminopeptidase/acylaminoacyl peptidase
MHPMDVRVLRQAGYPGSELVIEETLAPGSNYDRYRVSYQSEGLTIYALLTVPRGEQPVTGWPVIVFNHGYIPPAQYRTTERYVSYVDGFARNGYIVFRSDYRGHDRSEGDPSSAYGSPDYTIDVLNGLASVQRYPDADPDRIGMWGHSMGGYITLQSMVINEEIDAGVIWAGVVGSHQERWEAWRERARDWPTPTPDPDRERPWRGSRYLLEIYGMPNENPEFWSAIDPVTYLDDISGPVQLHHGTSDATVAYWLSESLAARLEEKGLVGELYLYEGDNHNLAGYFGTAMQRSIAFFDQYVKGAANSADEAD